MRIPDMTQTQILDKVHSRIETKDQDRSRVARPEDTERGLSIGRPLRSNCLRHKEHQFPHPKLQPLHVGIKCEHECGLRRTRADRHITTTPIRTEKLSATSHPRTLFHMQQAETHRSKLPHDYTRATQEETPTGKRTTSVEDGNSTDGMDKARGTIAALSTTEISRRIDKSPKDKGSTRLKDMKRVDDTGQGRKDSPGKELEKRT